MKNRVPTLEEFVNESPDESTAEARARLKMSEGIASDSDIVKINEMKSRISSESQQITYTLESNPEITSGLKKSMIKDLKRKTDSLISTLDFINVNLEKLED